VSGLPLDDPAIARLDGAARSAMARHWRRRAWSEGQVATAFAELHAGLIEVEAEAVVVRMIGGAAADEVRHSAVCAALAGAYLADAPAARAGDGVALPRFAGEARDVEVTLQVVGMCCVGETLATVWLEACLAGARTPLARAANRVHLREEVEHARAGWAHLAAPRTAGQRAIVEQYAPGFVRAGVREWLAAGSDLPVGTGLEGHGVLTAAQHRAAVLRGAREVVLPGFAALGIEVAATRRWLDELG
jgi:hypothetical protein